MKALIFGASGQDGVYLSETCRSRNIMAIGISRSGAPLSGDVSDFQFVEACVREHSPDYIFHLAANSTTGHEALFENHSTISTGALNVLEAVYRARIPARIFITGSSIQFRNTGAPVNETTPFEASSPYAVARIQSVYAARYYRSLGVKTFVGYFFHHESPLRKPRHLSQKIVQAAMRIKAGSAEVLEIGDLGVEKEWNFAGDVARAVLTLIEQDNIHEAVIGSGETHSIQEWAECCFSLLRLNWREHVKNIPGYKPEFRRLVSDPSVMRSLGWKPRTGFLELAEMMIEGTPRQ